MKAIPRATFYNENKLDARSFIKVSREMYIFDNMVMGFTMLKFTNICTKLRKTIWN